MSDYSKDIVIDKNALDREWLGQPSLYFNYAKKLVKADLDAKRAKENLEVVDAELFMEVKRSAEDRGEKTTVDTIKSLVLTHEKHKKAADELNEALEESKILAVAVEAISQRKYALENLVKLHLAGYYSSPSDVKDDDTTNKAIKEASSRHFDALSKKYSRKDKEK